MEVYTDGSCLGNPGPGGYAAIFLSDGQVKFTLIESVKETTNNRMELMGVITAFKVFKDIDQNQTDPKKFTIYCDSTYCINGITSWIKGWIKNGWKTADKKDVKNKDLWLELLDISKNIEYQLVKVKSHANIKFNEMADKMAKYAAAHQVS